MCNWYKVVGKWENFFIKKKNLSFSFYENSLNSIKKVENGTKSINKKPFNQIGD